MTIPRTAAKVPRSQDLWRISRLLNVGRWRHMVRPHERAGIDAVDAPDVQLASVVLGSAVQDRRQVLLQLGDDRTHGLVHHASPARHGAQERAHTRMGNRRARHARRVGRSRQGRTPARALLANRALLAARAPPPGSTPSSPRAPRAQAGVARAEWTRQPDERQARVHRAVGAGRGCVTLLRRGARRDRKITSGHLPRSGNCARAQVRHS